MRISNRIAHIAITVCIGVGMTACSPTTSVNSAATPTSTTTAVQPGINAQAQAALASYHEVDASFSDTARLSKAQFSTKLLGGLLGDNDDDNNDNSGLLDGILNGGNNNSSGTDASTNTTVGVNVGANVDSNSNSNSSLGLNTGASANVGSNANTSSNSNSSLGLNTGVSTNVNANLDGNSNNSSNSSLGLNTDINADVNTTFDSFNRSNSDFRNQISSTGSVSIDSNGGSTIDNGRLRTNVSAMVDSQNDVDLLNRDVLDLNDSNNNLDLNSRINAMVDVSNDNLFRLRDRNFNTRAGQIDSRTNANGSVTSFFGTNFSGNSTRRDVVLANTTDVNAQVGLDFVLREQGNGFSRNANRVSSLQADGSLMVMTQASTMLDNGDRIDIFEERVTDISGNGTGNGSLIITDSNGSSESFDLRTLVAADGSLTTFLDGQGSDSDLMIRESANGQASLSLLNDNRQETDRLSLSLDAMLKQMGSTDFNV